MWYNNHWSYVCAVLSQRHLSKCLELSGKRFIMQVQYRPSGILCCWRPRVTPRDKTTPNLRTHLGVAYVISALVHQGSWWSKIVGALPSVNYNHFYQLPLLGTFILDRGAGWDESQFLPALKEDQEPRSVGFPLNPVEPLPSDPGRQTRSETPISISCRVFPHLLSKYKLQTQASSHLPPNNFPTSAFSSPSP